MAIKKDKYEFVDAIMNLDRLILEHLGEKKSTPFMDITAILGTLLHEYDSKAIALKDVQRLVETIYRSKELEGCIDKINRKSKEA